MATNTIKLKSYSSVMLEKLAHAAITPGMLIEINSDDEVLAHNSPGANVLPTMVACENELEGQEITEAYEAADPVQVWIPQRGDEAYMILADGEAATIGDPLESNGAGYLQVHTNDAVTPDSDGTVPATVPIYTNQIVAVALEALDLALSSGLESSGTLGYNKRLKVRIV